MSHRAKYEKRKIKNVKCRRDRKRNLRKKIETRKAKLFNETQKIGKSSKFEGGSFDPKSIYPILPTFGTTEFICGANFDSIISKIIIYLAFIVNSETEKYIFSSINVITPPTEDYKDHKVWNTIFESFEKLSGLKLQDKHKRNIESRINIIKTKLLTKTSIDLILDKIDIGSAFILLDSHLYVDINSDEAHWNPGLSEMLLEEDYLTPNLSNLNRELTIKSKSRETYGVICTRKNPPEKEYNRNLLEEVEGCFPIFFETENDINSIVAKNTQIWYDTLITEGENSTRAKIINVGVSEIDLILAQLWHRNGNTKELKIKLNSIIEDINSYDPSTCLKIAGMYIKCHPNEISKSVSLIPEANLLNEKRFLHYGLLLSTELLNNDLIDSYFMKLSSSNPEDAYLRSNIEERILIISALSENENITKIGFTEKDLNFISILKCSNTNLDELIQRIKKNQKESRSRYQT
ncbi:MAG: hypothetical protein KBT79_10650 [Thalassolituus oleivorans]|nr:hypothetical protein [Thalassolituus oleivorans]